MVAIQGAIVSTVLRSADIIDAFLIGASPNANLAGADFTKANLTRADLTEADLTEANLTATVLSEANLTEANLEGAIVSTAQLAHAKNLHLAKNVDKIITPEAADSSDTTAPPAK